MSNPQIQKLAQALADQLTAQKIKVTTAESCTGGGVSHALTAIPGSSVWFDMAFVTYSNIAKIQLLGVSNKKLLAQGAVSEEVVMEMAEGALLKSGADLSVAITGVAGPSGGTDDKPVGSVWFGWAKKGEATRCMQQQFDGDREAIREQSVVTSLQGLLSFVEKLP